MSVLLRRLGTTSWRPISARVSLQDDARDHRSSLGHDACRPGRYTEGRPDVSAAVGHSYPRGRGAAPARSEPPGAREPCCYGATVSHPGAALYCATELSQHTHPWHPRRATAPGATAAEVLCHGLSGRSSAAAAGAGTGGGAGARLKLLQVTKNKSGPRRAAPNYAFE